MTIDLTCPFCGFLNSLPEEKLSSSVRWATCSRCEQRFEIPRSKEPLDFSGDQTHSETQSHPSFDLGEGGEARKKAPWEDRSELGLWQAIYQTIKQVLFFPNRLFKALSFDGGLTEPLAFGLLTGSIGAMFSVFWQFLMFTGGLISIADAISGQFITGMIFVVLIIFIPVITLVTLFVLSGIIHLFLLLFNGAGNGFEATFRVVAYSNAVQLCGLVPFLGGWISPIWRLIVQIIGLREIHETSYLKVILAFLIPVAIMVICAIAGIILIFFFVSHQPLGGLWS